MGKKLSRRDFVKTGAVTGLVAANTELLFGKAPVIYIPGEVKPLVMSAANGNKFKNGGDKTCVETAFGMIGRGDDVLDAVIAGVNIVELDPLDDSVGYGGLPDAEGVVQLDSCCMHGPRKQAGGVASLEGVRTPSLVAKAVMENSDHHLLVGKGAQGFARDMGFKIEDDLNTTHSREMWLEWKRRVDPEHYLDPKKREEASMRATMQMVAEGLIDPHHVYGTINCDGINSKGEISGVTTTSGLAWKIPGRVGDSPILGAGLYVDNEVGAAGSTGRGEANLYNLSSFYVVENMRRGMHPKDACIEALKRVKSNTVEKRLLDKKGLPDFHLVFYALNKKGQYASVSMYEGVKFALCDENGPRTLPCEPLLEGKPLH
jgi:N4-(beta-N-acetylglucosaminyl)-L-asparaginase